MASAQYTAYERELFKSLQEAEKENNLERLESSLIIALQNKHFHQFCRVCWLNPTYRRWLLSTTTHERMEIHFKAIGRRLWPKITLNVLNQQTIQAIVAKTFYHHYISETSEALNERLLAPQQNLWLLLAIQYGDFDAISEYCQRCLNKIRENDRDLLSQQQLIKLLASTPEAYGTPGYILKARYYTQLAAIEKNTDARMAYREKAYYALLLAEIAYPNSHWGLSFAYQGKPLSEIEPQFASWQAAKKKLAAPLSPEKRKHIEQHAKGIMALSPINLVNA